MQHTAKTYATLFYSYAKNYVKGAGTPVLSNKQCVSLLSLQEQNDIIGYVKR